MPNVSSIIYIEQYQTYKHHVRHN